MKYYITIICLFCSIMAFAQNPYTIPFQEKMEDSINAALIKYKQDSLQVVMRANEELKSLRESFSEAVIKEKEQYTKNVLATLPSSTKLQNVETFVTALMDEYDDPLAYLGSLEELNRINSQFSGYDTEPFKTFSQFLADLRVLEQSHKMLDKVTPRDLVFDNLAAINKANFYKQEQVKSIEPVIASLKKYDSARKYISYMLDAVQEAYDIYKNSKDVKEPTEIINDELDSTTGVSTICSVPCFEKIYKRVIEEVLVYNKDKSFDFDKFDIKLLEELLKELE